MPPLGLQNNAFVPRKMNDLTEKEFSELAKNFTAKFLRCLITWLIVGIEENLSA